MVTQEVEVLSGLLTTRQLTRLFHRSELTVTHWRNLEGLPYVRVPSDGGRDSVRYRLQRIESWATRTGRDMDPVVLEEFKQAQRQAEGVCNHDGFTGQPAYAFPGGASPASGEGYGVARVRLVG